MTILETLVYTGTHDIGANVTIGPCPTYFVCKSGLDWTNTTIHFLYFLLLLLLPRVPALFSTTLSHDAFVNLGDLKETFHLLGGSRVVVSEAEKKLESYSQIFGSNPVCEGCQGFFGWVYCLTLADKIGQDLGLQSASARSVSEILFCLFCSKYISILKKEFALLLRDPQVLRKKTIFDHKKRTLEIHRYIHTRYVIQLT